MSKYQVIVGNVGTVYDGDDEAQARRDFNECMSISRHDGVGRMSGEDVTLFEDGEPTVEFEMGYYDCNKCEHQHDKFDEEGHCYMFKDNPNGECCQFKI